MVQATQRAIRGLASDLAQRYLERARSIWTIDTRAIWENDPETTLQLVGVIAEVAIARRHAASTMAEVRLFILFRDPSNLADAPYGLPDRTRKRDGPNATAQDSGLDLALSTLLSVLPCCRRLRLCSPSLCLGQRTIGSLEIGLERRSADQKLCLIGAGHGDQRQGSHLHRFERDHNDHGANGIRVS